MTMSPSSEQVTASALIPTCRHGHRPPRGRRHRRTARPNRPLPPSRRLHASSRPFVDPPTVTGRCCPLSPARQQLPYLPFPGCHHQHVLDAAARVHLDGAVPLRRGHHGAPRGAPRRLDAVDNGRRVYLRTGQQTTEALRTCISCGDLHLVRVLLARRAGTGRHGGARRRLERRPPFPRTRYGRVPL